MEDMEVSMDTGSFNSSDGDINAVIDESQNTALVKNGNAGNGRIKEEEQFSIDKKLQYVRNQLGELSISVCKFTTCELSSLLLQIRLGEIKALKALLDVQQRDLHLLQTICYQPNAWSSSSGQSGKYKQLKKQHSIVFIGWDGDTTVNGDGVIGSGGKMADKSVRKSLDDAFKTAKTLHKHFKDAEEQYEEVLELVLIFESDVKSMEQVITRARHVVNDARTLATPGNRRSFASDAWALYDKSLHQLNEQQSLLQLIQDSARDLLSLEPYFDGECVRAQLSRIKTSYQQVKGDLIIRLKPLAISRLELEVVEISVVSSWLLQTDLFLQSLLRRRRINPTSTALDELSNEISDRQSQISDVENELNQVLMIFSGDELPLVTELGHQVTQCHVCLSELMEKLDLVRQLSEVDTTDNNMECLLSPLLEDDDPSILDIAISNLPNNIEVSFDNSNRPSSLSGLDEVDSGLDDIDLSSSHYSWAHFDTETIKRKDKSKRTSIHVQLSNIDLGEKRPELQQLLSQVDGLNFELLELVDRMNSTQLPPIPDIEEVHFAIDKCQVIQSETLEQHKILESLNNKCSTFLDAHSGIPAKLKQSLEVYLFDVATLWQKVNLKAAEKMRQLHDREREIGEFYGQLNNLLMAIEEAKKFLEWKELTSYRDTMERVRELHHLFMSKADLKHSLLQQIDSFVASTATTVATYVNPTNTQSKIVADLCCKKNEIQEGWLIVVEQLTLLCEERTLSTHVIRQCEKETGMIIEGADSLSSVGVDLTDVKKKHTACQQYLQQSKRIQVVLTEMSQCLCRHVTMDALTTSQAQNYQLLEQQVNHLDKVLLSLIEQLHSIETQLYTRLVLLKQFYQKWHHFKLWLNDTRQLLQSSGKALSSHDVDKTTGVNPEELTRLQANCQLIGAKQHRVKSIQNLANEILKLPAPQEELNKFEGKVNTTLQQWDDVCSMCIPAQGANSRSLPNLISGDVSNDAPHSSYELISLIVNVQEQLRPDHMIIGQTHQLRIQLSQLRCLEYKMKVAGAILKQVKNACKQTMKRRRSSTAMTKSSDCIEGMHCETHTGEETQNLSRRESSSRNNEQLMTISKSSTLPGHYKTSYKLPASIIKLFALWKSTWCVLCTKKKLLNALLEKWRRFETLRTNLLRFLSEANGYCNPPFEQLGTMTSLMDIDSEMKNFKHLSEDMMRYSDKLTELQKLSHRLLEVNCASTTEYLEYTMRELQEQWDVFEEKFLELKPIFSALWLRWQVFYEVYKQCHYWLNEKLTKAEQFSPLAKSDMKSVKIEMEQLKELRIEIDSQENSLVTVKQKALELIAGTGGGHINQEAIQEHMEVVGKKWQRLKHLTVQRQEAVEVVLVEKQDIVEKLANSVAWLKQAEDHMDQQINIGNDFSQVQSQYLAHKAFWQEVEEQVPKMELIIVAGKRLVDDMDWMQDEREHHVMQQITQQYLCIERRWKQLLNRGQEWGGLLDNLYPEMKQCQILCTTLGQRLTEAEVAFGCFEDITNCKSLIKLRDELSAQQAFETALHPLGELLDAIIGSQRRQTQLGVKVPAEMTELARSYHDRWNQLKAMVSSRHSRIQESITEFDTSNIMDTTLPKGWSRNRSKNGVPFFFNRNEDSMQWEHPELTATYQAIQNRYRNIKFASYRIALKLRSIQKKIQMNMLQLKNATDAFIRHDITDHSIDQTTTWAEMCAVASSMFQSVEKQCSSEVVNVARSVDLLTSWAMDIFDVDHTGKVPTIAYKSLVIVMTTAKLEEKYQQLFSLICNENQYADYQSLNLLLTHLVKLPASVNESEFCSSQNATNGAMECFNKADNPHFIHINHFLSWINDEPKALVWLPVLHRLAAAEDVEHNFKCTICKVNPIRGFRYRCLQCFNYNICQECFWCRKTSKSHTLAHSVQEFCLSSRSPDNVKGVVKLLKHKVSLIKRSSFKGSERPSVSRRKRTESRGSYSIDKSSSQGSIGSWNTPVTSSTPHASHHRLHINEPSHSNEKRSADIGRKLAVSYEALEHNHSHEREVDPKTKTNSLPVPRSAAYRPSSNSHQPSLPPVLQSDAPQPVLSPNESSDRQPAKAHADESRQSLQKRIQLLQDHNLKLLSHIKVFREAIDKRRQSQ